MLDGNVCPIHICINATQCQELREVLTTTHMWWYCRCRAVQVPLTHCITKVSIKGESAWVGRCLTCVQKRMEGCPVASLPFFRSICSDMTPWFCVMNKSCRRHLNTWSLNHLIIIFYLEEQLEYCHLISLGLFGSRSGALYILFRWSVTCRSEAKDQAVQL